MRGSMSGVRLLLPHSGCDSVDFARLRFLFANSVPSIASLVQLCLLNKDVKLNNLFTPGRDQLDKEFSSILRTKRQWLSPTPDSGHGFQSMKCSGWLPCHFTLQCRASGCQGCTPVIWFLLLV
jgi:hypothetical protein